MVYIEKELKYILDKKSFRTLYYYLSNLKKPDFLIRQVNYYFDTEEYSLQSQGVSIRIRKFKDRAELTCKISAVDENITRDFMHSYEYTRQLTLCDAKNYITKGIPINIIIDLIKPHNINISQSLNPLICHGHLRTARIGFTLEKDLEPVLLDINAYLGTFDYELEWETADIDKARTILTSLFNRSRISLPSFSKVVTKRKRYFKRKNSLLTLDKI